MCDLSLSDSMKSYQRYFILLTGVPILCVTIVFILKHLCYSVQRYALIVTTPHGTYDDVIGIQAAMAFINYFLIVLYMCLNNKIALVKIHLFIGNLKKSAIDPSYNSKLKICCSLFYL